jgi:hypothetical protein
MVEITVNGKVISQGDKSLELATVDWASQFAKTIEVRGLTIAGLQEKYPNKNGTQIAKAVRREDDLRTHKNQTGIPVSDGTRYAAGLALEDLTKHLDGPTTAGVTLPKDVAQSIVQAWTVRRMTAFDQAGMSMVIDGIRAILHDDYGVSYKKDDAKSNSEKPAAAPGKSRYDDDDSDDSDSDADAEGDSADA